MLSDFFQIGPIPPDQMQGFYDYRLVILSYCVATFASYIALDLTGRLRDVNNTAKSRLLWLCGGAFAMGAGIWSMHFIGMLAFSMPGMQMIFKPLWTGLSMVVAIFASGFALFLLKTDTLKWPKILIGGVILGLAIASMHYLGMQAMDDIVNIHYLPGLFSLSLVIAIVASLAALWLALKSNQVSLDMRFRLKFVSAFIMGAAICGMHYVGMFAAVFTHKAAAVHSAVAINPEVLAVNIGGVTFLILGIAVIVSTYKESQNQQLLATARQAGMAEVATSVLHNVGNVLNSVNVSAMMIGEKIKNSKIAGLTELSDLINEHKHELPQFIAEDPRGKMLPDYIAMLAKYSMHEQAYLLDETAVLLKHISHIKDVVSMQQSLSKMVTLEQVTQIDKLLEEALLITGIESNHPEIKIEKAYHFKKPVVSDKVKLLQILVNLLKNAKDALDETEIPAKKILLTIEKNGDQRFFIMVTDNGIGVPQEKITQIFSYGFTTKKEGHGYGLHSSALAAKEMKGSLVVQSRGLGLGATFVLDLPAKFPR